MPERMLRSTFSTTTIASSTTMPTARTRPKKRKIVQRYPERIENRKRPDEGDRNCDHRDNRGSPVLKKQEHDAEHEKDRDEDCDDHLSDRFGDEDRRIVNDFVIDALGELLL